MKTPPPAAAPLTIGALAQRTGFAASAIRYYEEIGLIPAAQRRPSGHRVYDPAVQEVLALVRRCRDFGFSIEATRSMVQLAKSEDGRDCVEARDIAKVHLDAIRTKMAELQALERGLATYVQACNERWLGGKAPECTILKALEGSEVEVCEWSQRCQAHRYTQLGARG